MFCRQTAAVATSSVITSQVKEEIQKSVEEKKDEEKNSQGKISLLYSLEFTKLLHGSLLVVIFISILDCDRVGKLSKGAS